MSYRGGRKQVTGLFVMLGMLGAPMVHAGPADTVYTPIVDYREWEIELRGGLQDWAQRSDGEQALVAAVGYGVAPRWFTELAMEYSRTPGAAAQVEEFEWENVIQLTEHRRYWMDVGLFVEWEHKRLENSNKIKIGPMLQKESGRSQYNLNVFLAREVGSRDAGAEQRETEVSWAAQWRWRGRNPWLQPGMQAFGKLGDTGDLHSQEMKIGPALFGQASLGGGHKFQYDAALLLGTTHATPGATLRFTLEYEFF